LIRFERIGFGDDLGHQVFGLHCWSKAGRKSCNLMHSGIASHEANSRSSDMSSIEIRSAVASDAATILSFIRELAEYERLAHEVVATEDAIASTLFGEAPTAEVLIATLDGAPVGFALFFRSYSTFLGKAGLYLEDLFVQPAARKRGVGLALMRRMAQICVQRGYGRLEWSVLDWNAPALRFYESLGAKPQSEWTVQRLTGDALTRLAR